MRGARVNVLVVGGGGREDALVWALSRSPEIGRLRCAPGNAGIARRAECVPIPAHDVRGLVAHAAAERYDLVVVGPETPLVAGLADRLSEAGIPTFGPGAAAAVLEGSKVFAKQFMDRWRIPTARFRVFAELEEATNHFLSRDASYPLVVKADGLAAGKGVVIAEDPPSAIEAAAGMLSGRDFGAAGSAIVVEEKLEGCEASFFVLSDGERFLELDSCRDYKRLLDGDRGPNTGGMGAYSPSADLDEATRATVVGTIVEPTVRGLVEEGRPYRGVLYIGLMLTAEGPKVLEYNARFGDPETQVLLPRLDGDWLPVLHAAAAGSIERCRLVWRRERAVCVVLASEGYPARGSQGLVIEGIEEAERLPGVLVFHAGTARDGRAGFVTAGGRVLGVTALAPSLAEARRRAYEAVARIRWPGTRHRTDIALEAITAGAA